MAHTDACKIQATQFVKKLVNNGLSVSDACKETERESDGIPAETIRRWWKEIELRMSDELVKNDQPDNDYAVEPKPPKKKRKPSEKQECETPDTGCYAESIYFAKLAISQLERIREDDPDRQAGYDLVENWINAHR
jgi:hypothetical protein